MIKVSYKLRMILIIIMLAIVFCTIYATLRAVHNHNEATRWAALNHSIHLGETTLVVSQVAVINYNPTVRGRVEGPFPHLLEFTPYLRDTFNRILYFFKPCPTIPEKSQIIISTQILFRHEAGRPNLAFILDKNQKNKSSNSVWGEGVVFKDISFTGVDWDKNDFFLTISDRNTGQEQSVYIQPVRWRTNRYHPGDLAPPYPPDGFPTSPILTGFLESFQKDLYEGGAGQEWKSFLVPKVRDTFPSDRMRIWLNGKQYLPYMIGVCNWEDTRPGYNYVYAYTLAYLDSESKDSMLRQKLYFVRWQDSWRVLDVGPVQPVASKTQSKKLDL